MQRNKDGGRKCFRQFGRFSLALLLVSGTLYAESFSEFKKRQAESYQKYKDERDAAFQSYLKEQWKAYKKFVSASLYEKPKPKKIAKTKPKPIKKVGPKVAIRIAPPPPPPKPKLPEDVASVTPKQEKPKQKQDLGYIPKERPKLKEKRVEKPYIKKEFRPAKEKEDKVTQKPETKPKPKPFVVVKKDVEFDFFGLKLGFDIPQGIKKAKFYPTNQKGIAAFFESAASSDYEKLLKEIKAVKKSMNLNDWGLYLLVNKIAQNTYKYDDEAKLLGWFLFNKLGYAVKVGLNNTHVVVMYYSKKTIYSTPNFRFEKKRYYVIANYNKGNIGTVYTYKQDYPNATKPIELSLKSLPIFEPDYRTKTLTFKHLGKEYEITYKYNKNLIDFFATYPQADYETFFNAPVDKLTYASIAQSLKEYINGKKASEAMNFVLNFVQNAFEYQTDQQQFGREKVMFAEETLFYKASDCEDRAILYSYLTKELFRVPVFGIKYPNHMATALYVPLEGDKIRIKGKEFVVADPTYINANIGQAMPQFKGKMPKEFIYVTVR